MLNEERPLTMPPLIVSFAIFSLLDVALFVLCCGFVWFLLPRVFEVAFRSSSPPLFVLVAGAQHLCGRAQAQWLYETFT